MKEERKRVKIKFVYSPIVRPKFKNTRGRYKIGGAKRVKRILKCIESNV